FRDLLRVAPEYVAAYQQAGQTLQRLGGDAEAGELLRLGIQTALKQNNEHAAAEIQDLLASLGCCEGNEAWLANRDCGGLRRCVNISSFLAACYLSCRSLLRCLPGNRSTQYRVLRTPYSVRGLMKSCNKPSLVTNSRALSSSSSTAAKSYFATPMVSAAASPKRRP